MMGKGNFLERLSGAADMTDEPMPGVPLVEIAGGRRVLIEHHCGVSAYGPEQIRVRVKFGQICVCGAGLVLTRMIKGQLIISGRIDSVQLDRGCS